MTTLAYVLLGIILGALLLIVLFFRAAWRVAEPDEALIISGFHSSQRPEGVGESMGFRIVTGRGRLVAPGITKVRRLSLDARLKQPIGVHDLRRTFATHMLRAGLPITVVQKLMHQFVDKCRELLGRGLTR